MGEAPIRPEMGLSDASESQDSVAIRCGYDWQSQVGATGAPETGAARPGRRRRELREGTGRALREGTEGCTLVRRLRPCGGCGYPSRTRRMAGQQESGRLDFSQGRNRRIVAVVVTADGRRVNVPLRDLNTSRVSLLDLLRSLQLGLESLLGLLITGSRRENGGTRRDGSR